MPGKKEQEIVTPQPAALAGTVNTEEPPGGTQYFHTDYVSVHWSLIDVKVRFGELVKHIPATNTSILWERAVVTMSWEEAKVLASVLQDAISRYEHVNGEIKKLADLKLP
jgi:hypothetical protein